MTLAGFADELSSDSPAPGGGSVAAYAGALAAGLAAMVANLSHPKQGFEAKQPALERDRGARPGAQGPPARRGRRRHRRVRPLARGDANAQGDRRGAAPRATRRWSSRRSRPSKCRWATLEACPEIVELCLEIGGIGLQASLSDAGTGAAMARAAASGAYQNVCINLPGLADRVAAAALLARADAAWERTTELAARAEAVFVGGLRHATG